MTPRPRKVSDEEVLAAASRVMLRVGPSRLTLGEIASEAGVTAAALVQRYGSKRALLLALMEAFAASRRQLFDRLRRQHGSGLAAVRGYAECVAELAPSPAALAHHLSYLQMDLSDPDFHRQARAQAEATRAELTRLLEEAVAAGELKPVAVAELARRVEVTVTGSLMVWAFYGEGTAAAHIMKDLEMLLTPLIAG